jgi:hypothetical protein
VISATGKLDIICQSKANINDEQGFPSWVPDWRPAELNTSEVIPHNPFHTSGNSLAAVDFKTKGQISCRGFKIDTVDGLGCNQLKGLEDKNDIIHLTNHSRHAYCTEVALEAAIAATLAAGYVQDQTPENRYLKLTGIPWIGHPALETSKISAIYRSFDEFRQRNKSMHIFGRQFCDFFPKARDEFTLDTGLIHSLYRAEGLVTSRRLLTTLGGYLGMGSKNMLQGDCVYVLLGCSIPVVLRPVEGGYKLLGECYIHGIMEGEAMDWLESGKCVFKQVTIY